MTENKTCPLCKGIIQGYPATSRKDNKTLICSLCGVKEALEIFNKNKQGDKMNEYEKLMQKSQEAREKAKSCTDVDLTIFYLNIAKGYELKARNLPVGQ